jgi:hypothetical protein
MPPRRRVATGEGRRALLSWSRGDRAAEAVALAVRFTLEELAERAPGGTIEVRVPPHGAVQCGEGGHHTRGTPPNVVETDAEAWLALATGRLTWADAVEGGRISASGSRADLSAWLPLDKVVQ